MGAVRTPTAVVVGSVNACQHAVAIDGIAAVRFGQVVHAPMVRNPMAAAIRSVRPAGRKRAQMSNVVVRACFAVLVSAAMIAGFFSTSSGILGFDRNLTIPGPLTAAHANLIDGKRCALCHEGHERQGLKLANALVEHQDISQRCSQCHDFDGHSSTPHNLALAGDQTHASIGCIGCHTEHKGASANISVLADADCHGCHKPDVRFQDFADINGQAHPAFSDGFGKLASSSLRFDHEKALRDPFQQSAVSGASAEILYDMSSASQDRQWAYDAKFR